MEELAQAEQLFIACCSQICLIISSGNQTSDELLDLHQLMVSTYYINLSIFRSLPNTWAINQLFPTMPLHRLEQKPTVNGTLADITCDSDGKIDRFIAPKAIKNTLELHPLKSKPYSI